MANSFEDYLASAAERYPGPKDSDTAGEELADYIESEISRVELVSLRDRFADLDEIVPEAAGVDENHPAFQAAIEMALFDRIRALGHLTDAPALASP